MENKEHINKAISYIESISDADFQIDHELLKTSHIQKDNNQQPIIIKILTIIGALITCIGTVGFILVFNVYENTTLMIALGILSIIIPSYLTIKNTPLFLESFLLSIYCIGYGLLGFGLAELDLDIKIISTLFLIISILTLLLIHNYTIVFISMFILLGSLAFMIQEYNIQEIYPFFVSLIILTTITALTKEAKIICISKHALQIYQPIKTSLILSYIISIIYFSSTFHIADSLINTNFITPIITAITSLLLILYILSIILKKLEIHNKVKKTILYITTLLILIPTSIQPSITAAILLLLTTFLVNYKTGFMLALIAFLYIIIRFYYDIDISLLNKSIILMTTGVCFFLIYFLTSKKLSSNEEN